MKHWMPMKADPDGGDPGLAAEPTVPEWVAEEFKTAANPVEAQAQAYQASRTEMKRAQSELDRKDKEFAEALSRIEAQMSVQQTPPYNPNVDPTVAAYQRALEEGDAAGALAIQLQLTQAVVAQQMDAQRTQFEERFAQSTQADRDTALRLAEAQVGPTYGERWDSLAPRLNERLTARPDLLPQMASVEGYAAVLAEQANVLEAERIVTESRQAEAERQAKLAAQTLDGSTARVPTNTDEKKAEWERIKGAGERDWNSVLGG